MSLPPPSADEACRLQLLAELEVLDTPPEAAFDALTRAARLATGWPIALIGLIDRQRLWFKSSDGLDVREMPLDQGLCPYILLQGNDVFEVADLQADARFSNIPLIEGEPELRAYAGQPLIVQGVRLGALSLMHRAPARLPAAQLSVLQSLAAATSGLLEERLHRSKLSLKRERLADFGAASGDWLWETDEHGRVVWLSGSFELAMGGSAASQLGQPLPDRPLVDARGQPLRPAVRLHDLIARHRAFSRATIAMAGEQGERWISLSAVPVSGTAPHPRGMRGTARNVTDQILAERKREAELQRLHKLVELVPGALYQFRVNTRGQASFPYTTTGLQTLFEVSPDLAASDAQPVFNRIHPSDLPRIQRSIEASLAGLTPWQAAFRVLLPGAGERHLTAHSSPQREPDGSVLWHGLVTDVTSQVMETQARDRLQRERDRAQQEARARADALSRISHELRTPLNAILGFTQLMQASLNDGAVPHGTASLTVPGEWTQWVRQVHRAGSHLLALVNDVLEASSLEARRFVVDLQPVDACTVAQQVVDMVRPQAQLRGQRLDYVNETRTGDAEDPSNEVLEPRDERIWVLADKRALRQVLINLLGNACKYTPREGIVELRLRRLPGQTLRLEVCDNGPGMSAEQQARLFKPFERGEASEGATTGTGLGLVISRQLVRAMRGQLKLRSAPGQGSVFAIELPMAERSETSSEDATSATDSLFGGLPAPRASAPAAGLPAATLLYVEDDPVNGLLMQEFVSRTPPLRLHVAVDLATAWAAALTLQPALILLDMHLPDGTGYDLLRRLRGNPTTAGLRVVALSADAMPSQMKQARDAGFDDYWTKPVDFTLLRQRLAELLHP